jgi:hypothetical protein
VKVYKRSFSLLNSLSLLQLFLSTLTPNHHHATLPPSPELIYLDTLLFPLHLQPFSLSLRPSQKRISTILLSIDISATSCTKFNLRILQQIPVLGGHHYRTRRISQFFWGFSSIWTEGMTVITSFNSGTYLVYGKGSSLGPGRPLRLNHNI